MKTWLLLIIILLIPFTCNAHSINDPNLMGLWYFEDDCTDESTNSNDLTPVGSPAYNVEHQQGAKSIRLDRGSSQYLSSADTDFNPTGNISFGGWFYPLDDTNGQNVFSKHKSGDYGFKTDFKGDDVDKIDFGVSSDGSAWSDYVSGETDFSTGSWQHFVWVYDGSHLRLYKDGSELERGVFPQAYSSGINVSAAAFLIGYAEVGGAYLDAYCDELFFFSDALTAGEVSDIHTSGFSVPTGAQVIIIGN